MGKPKINIHLNVFFLTSEIWVWWKPCNCLFLWLMKNLHVAFLMYNYMWGKKYTIISTLVPVANLTSDRNVAKKIGMKNLSCISLDKIVKIKKNVKDILYAQEKSSCLRIQQSCPCDKGLGKRSNKILTRIRLCRLLGEHGISLFYDHIRNLFL